MSIDLFTSYALNRQPAGLGDALKLFDERTKGPDASSPHVVTHEWLQKHLCWTTHRRHLLKLFDDFIAELTSLHVAIDALLIGGSFVSFNDAPKDIDFLVIYRASCDFDPELLSVFVKEKRAGLDWRFIPADTGTIPLLKISIFCHLLFEGRKGGEGSLLLVP